MILPRKIYFRFKTRTGSWQELLLFQEALFFIFLAKVMLVCVSTKTCFRWIRDDTSAGIPDPELVRCLRKALTQANRLTWWKNVCMVQSIAGRWMLKRRGIASTFSIGIKQNRENQLLAHAWLSAGGDDVVLCETGYIPLIHC